MNNETKKGKLVPELRFPGFEGEWEVKKLGEVCNITMGQSPSSEYYNTNGIGMPLIQGNADFNDRKSIIRNYTSQITKSCNKGDVILTVRAPVGAVGIASYDSCIGRGVCALKNAHQYLYQYLLSIEDSWEKYSAGSTFTCVNSDVLSSIPIPLPVHEAEQQKIAECLSSVDNLIQAEADQLQALKDHKKGLMQQLFPQEGETTPKLRFPGFEGEWEEKKLGECLLQTPDYGLNAPAVPFSDNLPVYLRITDISDDGKYIKDGKVSVATVLTKDNSLQEGDIVFARTGASVGKTYKYRVEDGLLVFAGFLIRIKPDETQIDSEFLFQYTQTKTYKKWVEVTSTRSGQPGINSLEISSLLILFPSLPEQQKIASCLSSLDEGIAAQQRKVEALKEHKKGLMQKIFPTIN